MNFLQFSILHFFIPELHSHFGTSLNKLGLQGQIVSVVSSCFVSYLSVSCLSTSFCLQVPLYISATTQGCVSKGQLELSLILFRSRDTWLNYAFQVPKEVKQTLKFTNCFAKGRTRKKKKSSQKNVNIHQRRQQNPKANQEEQLSCWFSF